MSDRYKFLLLTLMVPVLTFPGSLAFANWDAPYGFYKDLSIWLGSMVGGWLLLLPYALFAWRRKYWAWFPMFLLLILLGTALGYWAELQLGGAMGYGSGNPIRYLIGGVLGFLLSLMILASAVVYPGTWSSLKSFFYVYPYDRPLLLVWLVLLGLLIFLIVRVVHEGHSQSFSRREVP